MTQNLRAALYAMRAHAIDSADAIAAFWNSLPDEQTPRSPDPVVLAIFASAGAASIVAAVALVATIPR